VTTANEIVSDWNGLHNALLDAFTTVADDLTALTDTYTTNAGTLAGIVGDLFADGLPDGPFSLGGADGLEVSVLRYPEPQLPLATEPGPLTVSLCEALAPLFATLGESELAEVLNERAAAGVPLQGPLPNPV